MADTSVTEEQSAPVHSTPARVSGRDRAARIAALAVVAVALVVSVIQFELQGGASNGSAAPRGTSGAIWRWRKAVHAFWAGDNIYRMPPEVTDAASARRLRRGVWLHPNMPFVVILLTPFAYLPPWAMGLTWNLAKLAVLTGTCAMLLSLVGQRWRRGPPWVLILGLLSTLPLLIGDIRHGNTNIFVLGGIVAHLWCYRRGWDLAAGVPLALAICLKLTPTIFVLYWLYQRNWRLLAGTMVALAIFAAVVPLVALGPTRCADLTGTWVGNLILPGLVRGDFYPVHMNQSAPGVLARYFLDGPGGNIHWNPDDAPYSAQKAFEWITLTPLTPAGVKAVTRGFQVAIVALLAGAIGWRKLARDDPRRSLHYGLVVIAMLLLNQRTWDHHAVVLLVAAVPLWHFVAAGRLVGRVRRVPLALLIIAVAGLWLTRAGAFSTLGRLLGRSSRDAGHFADVAEAYGPLFYHLLLLLAVGAIVLLATRNSPRYEPIPKR